MASVSTLSACFVLCAAIVTAFAGTCCAMSTLPHRALTSNKLLQTMPRSQTWALQVSSSLGEQTRIPSTMDRSRAAMVLRPVLPGLSKPAKRLAKGAEGARAGCWCAGAAECPACRSPPPASSRCSSRATTKKATKKKGQPGLSSVRALGVEVYPARRSAGIAGRR